MTSDAELRLDPKALEAARAKTPWGREAIAADIIRAYLAALRSDQKEAAEGVQVKALEWLPDEDDWKAEAVTGWYRVRLDKDDLPFAWSLSHRWRVLKAFLTAEDAKVAAQADYSQRVLSAIHPIPDRGEVEATVEPEWWYDPDDPEIAGEFSIVTDDKPAGKPWKIVGASTVKVVWWAHLPPADDADSDDEWECEAATEADCLRLLADENDRRAALSSGDTRS